MGKNMKHRASRLAALLLAMLMLLSGLPWMAAAAEDAPSQTAVAAPIQMEPIVAAGKSYEEFQQAILDQLAQIHYMAEAELQIDARPYTEFRTAISDALASKQRVHLAVTYDDAAGTTQVLEMASAYAILLEDDKGVIHFDEARLKLPELPELPYEAPQR